MKPSRPTLRSRITCFFFGHVRIYMTDKEARRRGAMTSFFRPYKCSRCGHKSPTLKYPPCPPMPPVKPPRPPCETCGR